MNATLTTLTIDELVRAEVAENAVFVDAMRNCNPQKRFATPLDILLWKRFRRSRERDIAGVIPHYESQIAHWVSREQPIAFVLIAFPFKTRTKTNRRTPDAGEFWFISQLARLSHLMRTVYEPGAHFTILTESEVFAPLFEVAEAEWQAYLDGIRLLAEALNAPLDFLSLKQLVDGTPNFWTIFERRLRETKADETHHLYRVFLRAQNDVASTEKAVKMMRWYLAFGETRYETGVPADVFPNHLYVSVTAKPGRLAIWHIQEGCDYLPHQGVPVRIGSKKRILPLGQANGAEPVYVEDERFVENGQPFLYRS